MFPFRSRLLVSQLARRRVGGPWMRIVRFQSRYSFDDDKLKEIIESSNFGVKKDKQEDMLKPTSLPQPREKAPTEAKSPSPETDSGEGLKQVTPPESGAEPQPEPGPKPVVGPGELFTQKFGESIHNQIKNLPSQKEKLRYEMSKKLEKYLDSLQETILTATRALNDVTGYSAIEKLKKSIDELENELKTAKDNVKSCKELYTIAIQRRSTLQKEMNDLLTRKHNWSSQDLERFTELYRNDHANEQEEITAEANLNKVESQVDAIQVRLTQLILTRYHEEQIWSDKIRRASTWGTWILMGINIFLFMVATFFVEPWKRRRMVGSFEDKMKQAIRELQDNQTGQFGEILARVPSVQTPAVAEKEVVAFMNEQLTVEQYVQADKAPTPSDFGPVTTTDAVTAVTNALPIPESRPVPVTLGLPRSLTSFKHTLSANYRALFSLSSTSVELNKQDLAFVAVAFTLSGYAIGALTSILFR